LEHAYSTTRNPKKIGFGVGAPNGHGRLDFGALQHVDVAQILRLYPNPTSKRGMDNIESALNSDMMSCN
jgi:hypothetical protein